ncbi:hypothetical protein KP509_09G085700 [Ceratopteris richardii]|uniref:Uncharacterized protein n=1 Tax=Ceratopteris richardii TaxID=49495 RepID=A0A8T2U8A9_CERRI|nr:hypothetical protein KP509_09G085700 [Ceratopteris richardii]
MLMMFHDRCCFILHIHSMEHPFLRSLRNPSVRGFSNLPRILQDFKLNFEGGKLNF